MTIMVMKLARLYLKIVTTDMKEIIITTTMTTVTTTTMTTMTEMSIQNIMFRKRTAVAARIRAAVLSPHVLSPQLHHLIPHVTLQALLDQGAPRVTPVVRVPKGTSAIPALRVLLDR
jgi:hypothetical protein